MKPILLFIIFITNTAYAIQVKIPVNFDGIKEDPKARQGEFFVYNLEGKISEEKITPEMRVPAKRLEDVASTLIYAYQQSNSELFKSLFDETALEKINSIPKKSFEDRFQSFKSIERPVLEFYFKHLNGYISKWKEDKANGKTELLFITNQKGWKISDFNANEKDALFYNISNYLTYRNFSFSQSVVTKNVDFAKNDYILELKTTHPIISFFKLSEGVWEKKIEMRDNVKEKYLLQDENPASGLVKIKFDPDIFTARETHDILIVSSTYPIKYLPQSFAKTGQLKISIP
ncbi:MAG: hypothetical protein K2P81_01245 [Bacteriovoracaceae bacterium]|nr:hypothetical protein [Bacteriovoracaceae bacterium]